MSSANSPGAPSNRAIRKMPPARNSGRIPARRESAVVESVIKIRSDRASELAGPNLSPYRHFSRDEWARLRADTPLTLTLDDLKRLQSINDPISVEEVVAIYLPLSRLLALYVAATQGLF